jgi:hypothetical protein
MKQGPTKFIEIGDSRQNCRHQMGDVKQIPYKGVDNMGATLQYVIACATWRPGFVYP